MSRKKKQIYATVLILGAVAMLVDRVLSPTSSKAAQGATARSLEALGVEAPGRSAASVAAAPFPGSMPPHGSVEELRDVFAITERVRSRMLGLDPDDMQGLGRRERGRRPGRTPPALFEQSHALNAVLTGDDLSFAIVDGQWLGLGDRLDNCVLTHITGTSVTFECAGGPAALSVVADVYRNER